MDKEKGDWVISPIIYFHEELISLNEKSGTLNRTTLVEFIGLLGLKFKKKRIFLVQQNRTSVSSVGNEPQWTNLNSKLSQVTRKLQFK